MILITRISLSHRPFNAQFKSSSSILSKPLSIGENEDCWEGDCRMKTEGTKIDAEAVYMAPNSWPVDSIVTPQPSGVCRGFR